MSEEKSRTMTSKFLESDEVDSKIFAGRVLTLLGEILSEIHNQHRKLEEMSYFPSDGERAMYREVDESINEDEDDVEDEDGST